MLSRMRDRATTLPIKVYIFTAIASMARFNWPIVVREVRHLTHFLLALTPTNVPLYAVLVRLNLSV